MESSNNSPESTAVPHAGRVLAILLLCAVLVGAGFVLSMIFQTGNQGFGGLNDKMESGSFPGLKGRWVLEMDTISKLNKSITDSKNVHFSTGIASGRSLVTIDEQDGFRFAGNLVTARGEEEIFVGVIGFGGNFINGVSETGYFWADFVTPDKAIVVYHHNCASETTAGRGVMTRQK